MQKIVEVVDLTKRFAGFDALSGITFDVHQGEFVTLLGASGCGKTTTIRIVAGYLMQTAGEVYIDDAEVSSLPPQKRNVGMVFQNYALFPHMTVRDNIAFGLKVRRRSKGEIRKRVDELLEITSLQGCDERRPHQLSGGMQQRVALARALAFHPRILLMDEPLGALDVKLRRSMQVELKRLQRELGVTTIYVTHDQEEAMSMSDRLVVMRDGAIMQIGSPEEVYSRPSSTFVADFVGASNLLHGVVVERTDRHVEVAVAGGKVLGPPIDEAPGATCVFVLRPELVEVRDPTGPGSGPNQFPGRVSTAEFMGSWLRLTVDVPELERSLVVQASADARWREGASISVTWKPEALIPTRDEGRPVTSAPPNPTGDGSADRDRRELAPPAIGPA